MTRGAQRGRRYESGAALMRRRATAPAARGERASSRRCWRMPRDARSGYAQQAPCALRAAAARKCRGKRARPDVFHYFLLHIDIKMLPITPITPDAVSIPPRRRSLFSADIAFTPQQAPRRGERAHKNHLLAITSYHIFVFQPFSLAISFSDFQRRARPFSTLKPLSRHFVMPTLRHFRRQDAFRCLLLMLMSARRCHFRCRGREFSMLFYGCRAAEMMS
jgi:hypothetical protein